MARQIILELYIGQQVLVYPNPTTHPFEAKVTHIDTDKQMVHVKTPDYAGQWACRPRAITSLQGHYLRVRDDLFYFEDRPPARPV